ncbi:MAG TPA: hypothetical protein DIC52_23980 [Candidatus Latescibacteria bacterium]|nr:hypothetical protein [Candidatus Latescibacterota bacterium]
MLRAKMRAATRVRAAQPAAIQYSRDRMRSRISNSAEPASMPTIAVRARVLLVTGAKADMRIAPVVVR